MAEGLRERKRRAAKRAMERAAVDIAYDEGVSAVTVDRVCEAAMVSRSTFFNYFSSLEQAIFGSPLSYDPELTEEILSQHPDDLVLAASLIVMESVRGQADDEVTRRRFALFAREPGTTSRVSWASHQSREGLIAVVAAWLDRHPERARLTDADHQTEARLTVAFSIMLGDEVQRFAREVDGVVLIEPETFRTARRRMAAISAPVD
ncbi:TetR/AcrR family transcriptional regulator [Microbacterium sp. zg-Y818]|uniref:TetR/AcrR family transcriptional regulator n=1 Tax=unclassified Microbacterium TaxID=2609290 RepID=UPI00214AE0D9|nr:MULTISPECIES: TetR/AcrR family transcriptional regulator [unclassified Microbacterium]MCR2799646.1 TetR/AcrR family transcriptional regulator [Microbacterium sp. zg.Y818]WIM21635.1 TetR/AcrR family transcriptional regulator [Microbacterium sp. zg-Y818]